MTPQIQAQRGFLYVLMLLAFSFQGCMPAPKDRFALTAKDVGPSQGPADLGYIDDGYSWGFGNLGSIINGHGLPDQARTFVITHRSATGQTEVIWPAFAYGDNQANAVVLDHTLVFEAMLTNGDSVLMACQAGEPPMVISPAVLRLAAKRLGTSVIVPDTDYYFSKVRLPPDRVWLKGESGQNAEASPSRDVVFKLELNWEDLSNVVVETHSRAKLKHAGNFDYLAEDGPLTRISSDDAKAIGATAVPAQPPQTAKVVYKTWGYTTQREELYGTALLDASNQYAYFSTHHEPCRILKVALSDNPQTPPVVVGVATFEGEEDNAFNSVIDAQNGYAYFCADGYLVKAALGSSNTPPYRVGSVLVSEDWGVGIGVLDGAEGYGCFQVNDQLVKFRLGKGDESPSIVSRMDLPQNGPNSFESAVYDPTTHCAYFGADKVYKVALGEGDAAPRLIGSLAFPEGESDLRGAMIDPQNGYAWLTSADGSFIKIALGETNAPPRLIGALNLGDRFQYAMYTFGFYKDYAYIGTMGGGKTGDPGCCAGGVLKIALGKGDEPPRLVSFMALDDGINVDEGFVNPVNQTLCLGADVAGPGEGCKLFTLSLGETNEPTAIVARTSLFPK